MAFRYFCEDCGKTYIGPPLPGAMTCNCMPPKQISGRSITQPLSGALTRVVSVSEAATLRAQLCQRWGITNKSHKSHGANFSKNQTVVQLISNIVGPVSSSDWERVRALVKTDYSYDIDTQQMTD